MSPLRLLLVSGTILSLSLVNLTACGGSSSSSTGPGYTLTAAALSPASITAGATSTSAITVTPATGYSGSVTLSCPNLASATAITCSFSTNPVAVSGGAAASSTLTVTTTNNTPGGTQSINVTGSDAHSIAPSNGPQSLSLVTTAVFQHIVVIFQENRTPDNLFQDPVLVANGADIAFTANSFGTTIPLSPIDLGTAGSNPQNYDLSHAHAAFVDMYDGGKMDGASLIPCSPAANCPPNAHPNAQFMYVMPSDVQPYFAMAEQYTFGDRMFQTNEGPSFPAHQFILSGTSAPTATSSLFAAENPEHAGATGCIAAPSQRVLMIDPSGEESSSQYPCYEHATL